MKKTFLLIILLPIIGFSQMRNRLKSTDLNRYELKGNVKEMVFKEYEPRFSNDTTYTLEVYDFLGPSNFKLEFNEYGNLKKKSELRTENDSIKVGAIWNYKYDNKNRILQEQRFSFQYSKDTITWNYEYVGDSIINVRQLDKTYKILYYTYIEKGNFEFLNHANSDSSYVTKRLYLYDKFNRVIRSEDYENKEFVQDLRITSYKDTITSNKFKEVVIWTKHNNSFYNEFEYNENDNSIKMIIGNFNKNDTSINRYEYDYDKFGNWIEKRHFGWRGKLSTVFRREIKYYE
jgi:hypothetical protein